MGVFRAFFKRFFFQKTLFMYKNQFKKTSAFFKRFLGLFQAFFERFLSVFYFYFFFRILQKRPKNAKKTEIWKTLQAAPRFLERFGAFWSVFKNAIAFFARHFFARADSLVYHNFVYYLILHCIYFSYKTYAWFNK